MWKKRRKKTAATARVMLPAAERPNERWSMGFVTDRIVTGHLFRVLVIFEIIRGSDWPSK